MLLKPLLMIKQKAMRRYLDVLLHRDISKFIESLKASCSDREFSAVLALVVCFSRRRQDFKCS